MTFQLTFSAYYCTLYSGGDVTMYEFQQIDPSFPLTFHSHNINHSWKTAHWHENIEIINLSNSVNKTIMSFEVLAYEKNIHLSQKIEDNVFIKSNEGNVDKMLNILLDNALKYASDDGYINIELKKEKKKIVFVVENSGGNLESEDIDKIFQRFYKKNNEDNKSFGLGLAILKAIVDSINGNIKVECEKDKYTRFIIVI